MTRLHDKLSPRLRFWLGFVCCPLITFVSAFLLVLIFVLVDFYLSRSFNRLTGNWAYVPLVFFGLSGLVYIIAIPVLSGFSTAFFWRQLSCRKSSESTAGFWSVVLAWLPMLFLVPAWPFFIIPFLIFLGLYSAAMGRGVEFWNSNRPRQWIGDFSDMDSP